MSNRPSAAAAVSHLGHSISVVAARTGLSQDVLRMWERRYQAVAPTRTAGRQRRYSDEDLRRFTLLAAATAHGRTIGAIARLPTDELARIVAADDAAQPASQPDAAVSVARTVAGAMDFVRALDGAGLEALLHRVIARDGVPLFLESLVPSLMRSVGDAWAAGTLSIGQEHLTSSVTHSIVLGIARGLPSAPSAPSVLIATPSGEHHAVGAALAAAAAALEGWRVVYLGADVPAADIVASARATDARAVALSVVYVENRAHIVAELSAVRASLDASTQVFVGGAGVSALATDLHKTVVTVCTDVAELRRALARAPKH